MGIFIKDAETDKAVRNLANLRGTTLTEAIRSAVLKDLSTLAPDDEDVQLERLDRMVKAFPDTGLAADTDFYDGLYED